MYRLLVLYSRTESVFNTPPGPPAGRAAHGALTRLHCTVVLVLVL